MTSIFSYSFSSSFCCIHQIFYWKVWIELWRNGRNNVWDLLTCQINPRVPLLCNQHIDWFLYSWKSDIIAPLKLQYEKSLPRRCPVLRVHSSRTRDWISLCSLKYHSANITQRENLANSLFGTYFIYWVDINHLIH